jgi:hypothetical protein
MGLFAANPSPSAGPTATKKKGRKSKAKFLLASTGKAGRDLGLTFGVTPRGELESEPLGHVIKDNRRLRQALRNRATLVGNTHYIGVGVRDDENTTVKALGIALRRLQKSADPKCKTVFVVMLRQLSP